MAPSGTNFSMSDVYRKLCICLTLHLFHTTDNGQRKIFHSKVPIRDMMLLYGSKSSQGWHNNGEEGSSWD